MKIRFDANQEYQLDAIGAAVDVFDGQEFRAGEFELGANVKGKGLGFEETGVRNELNIDEAMIAENVRRIQERNNISEKDRSFSKKADGLHFSVEMETGTGKTYVYLRTIFELHKQYGFSKFVIVVPSVAIREGVLKTIEMTKEHFSSLYDTVPFDKIRTDRHRRMTIHMP